MEPIIRESELLKYDFCFIKAEKIHASGFYVQIAGGIDEFVNMCRNHQINTVFYKYSFYDPNLYFVTNEILENYTDNAKALSFCRAWAKKYNKNVASLDFDDPCGLVLCSTFASFTVICAVQNEWMKNEVAEDALLTFQEEHDEDLSKFYETSEFPSLTDDLAEILLSDKTFRYCTNNSSRSNYMKQFLKKKENKRFLALAKGIKDEWERECRIDEIVNQIYNEYRNNCYKLKIRVGDELPKE